MKRILLEGFRLRIQAWTISFASPQRSKTLPRTSPHCHHVWTQASVCWAPPLLDNDCYAVTLATSVPLLSPSKIRALPKISGVSLFCLPGHSKRKYLWGWGGTPPSTELGTTSKEKERLVEGQPEQYLLPHLSPDSQRDHDPSTSARKDNESLH